MNYQKYKPGKLLSEYVDCYWAGSIYDQSISGRGESFVLIPDGVIELAFNFGDGITETLDSRKEVITGSYISGIRKYSPQMTLPCYLNLFCVRFKLGGIYPFFQVPMNLLTNTYSKPDEFLGKEYGELEERMYEASDNLERVALIERYLLKKLRASSQEDHFVKDCSDLLFQDTSLRVSQLGDLFGTTYKTIERKFKKAIGVRPSELIKIKRINNAIHSIYSSQSSTLTEVAYTCGYYDQSHFIREFKQVTTHTPREFVQKQYAICLNTEFKIPVSSKERGREMQVL
ncbi:AraC family transcriptional regulator [Rapidithrix thailandica]|uniref:AraC family transcriptional regulator n=1 Tax=Rapidithrix thailandica TaxID=413964 RepID=A0AAW9S3C3_9BACT